MLILWPAVLASITIPITNKECEIQSYGIYSQFVPLSSLSSSSGLCGRAMPHAHVWITQPIVWPPSASFIPLLVQQPHQKDPVVPQYSTCCARVHVASAVCLASNSRRSCIKLLQPSAGNRGSMEQGWCRHKRASSQEEEDDQHILFAVQSWCGLKVWWKLAPASYIILSGPITRLQAPLMRMEREEQAASGCRHT